MFPTTCTDSIGPNRRCTLQCRIEENDKHDKAGTLVQANSDSAARSSDWTPRRSESNSGTTART
jgi:hypothetical protein